MRRFTCNAYLKVFFADEEAAVEEDEEIEKLRVNSKWMPTEIPNNIASRVGNFEGAFTRLFRPRNGKSNITKFQATILQSIRENENIIIAHADKNLGPIGVDTSQYICWALDDHLLDATTYQQVSEDAALQCTSDLYYEIYQWTNNFGIASSEARLLLVVAIIVTG